MGILSNTQTIVRYQVEGKIDSENIIKTILEGLKKHSMPEQPEEYQEIMAGWVPLDTPYNPDFYKESFQYGPDFFFSLRIDKKTIPAKVLAQQLSVATQERIKETGRDFLSRNEKAEIKDLIVEKLTLQIPFVPTIHEIHWDYKNGTIMFYSGQKSANELFETVFLKSFGLKVYRLFPYTMALKDSTDIEIAEKLVPSKIGGAAC